MSATANQATIERLSINRDFERLADDTALERAADALRGHGMDVRIVDTADQARELALGLLPEGAEVGQGSSVTLEQSGISGEVETSGRYEAVRPRTRTMNRATQALQIRKLSAAPEFFMNSVNAVTEDGQLVIVSMTGSQLSPLAYAAQRVILVVGAQKIVPDLATAMRRIDEYSYPIEDARAQEAYGMRSGANKILIVNREFGAGRITVILVRERLGN
jgi:hypothetical protein